MKKLFMIIVSLILLITNITTAAEIKGTIYDYSLNPIKNTIIEINTEPAQKYLAKDGSYTFQVQEGTYILTAKTTESKILTQENITIKNEGEFNLDLFVFESTDYIEQIIADSNQITVEDASSYTIWIILIIIGLILLSTAYFLKKKQYKEKSSTETKLSLTETEPQPTENDLNKILKIIKQEGGRTTQKEIRKHFPLSEAKISLMITELEHKNKIEKIKKGRANVIILKD